MHKSFILLVAVVLAVPSAAHPMEVATYLAKIEALRSRGMAAMFSSDFKELQSEVRTSAAALKRERLAAVQKGQTPAYCAPEKISLAPEEIFAAAQAIPSSRRAATPLKDAIRSALARKYPCRG